MTRAPSHRTRARRTLLHLVTTLLLIVPIAAAAQSVWVDELGTWPHDGLENVGYAWVRGTTVAVASAEGRFPDPRGLWYAELEADGTVAREPLPSSEGTLFGAELIVDAQERVHVLADTRVFRDGAFKREVYEHVRVAPGSWSSRLAVACDNLDAELVASSLGPSDSLYALLVDGYDEQLYLASDAGGSWQLEALPVEAGVSWVHTADLAVDPRTGVVHIAYGVTNQSVSPSRWELRYLSDHLGSWHIEVIAAAANSTRSMHTDPSIALTGDGRPVVASTLLETATTGSAQYAQLRYNERSWAGSWTSTVVATRSDGFSSGDGTQYTGMAPRLVVDALGRAHIAFADMACNHDAGYQWCQRGQVRLASRSGGSWRLRTLLSQTVNPGSNLGRALVDGLVLTPGTQALSAFAYEGHDENTGWIGTYSLVRVHLERGGVFSDGFESGDGTAWSASVP